MKVHKDRKKVKEVRSSVIELHNNRMKEFDKVYKTLPDKKEKLAKLSLKLEKRWSIDTLKEIDALKQEIERIESNEDMTEYLLDIRDVLKKKGERREKKERKKIPSVTEPTSVNSFLITETDNRKKKLLNEYLIAAGMCPEADNTEYCDDDFVCHDCNSTNMIVCAPKSEIICEECGVSRDWQDPNLPQWSNETDVSKTYRYQRTQYFIEHLNRFQGKENVNLDNRLIQKILLALHKRRINDKKDINTILIRGILKDLNETDYYDHINSIKRRITGEKAPQLSQEVERKLIVMFRKTIKPFEDWKVLIKGRMNFLSYPYVIRKLMRILVENGHPELKTYIYHFRLLKSIEKVRDQEKIWEKICIDNKWPFHKSV